LVYLVVVGIIGLLVYLAAPPIIEEVGNFYQNFQIIFLNLWKDFLNYLELIYLIGIAC